MNKVMKGQYVVFYEYYKGSKKIYHHSFDVDIQSCALLTMDEIYMAVRDYIGSAERFTIISITKLN